MNYIRTKERIFEVLPNQVLEDDIINTIYGQFCKQEIIAKADTIEELCDEFVRIDTKFNIFLLAEYDEIIEEIDKFGEFYEGRFIYYGAVWTSKGLIYVAKMNDKGELELI